jgi:hypothetical protein
MKSWVKITSLLYGVIFCLSFCSCSSDEESNDPVFDMSRIVGSQWERSYSWTSSDDPSWEKGKGSLTFSNSHQAIEEISYSGEGFEYNYNLGIYEFKSYSGSHSVFYTYEVEGNRIVMQNEDTGATFTATLSGNKLVSEDYEWILVAPGTGSADGDNGDKPTGPSYSWENMQGVWMDDLYDAYSGEILELQKQNMPSGAFLGSYTHGNFRVWGVQFNQSGQMREVDVQFKTFYNTGALVLRTIYASDRKTVYWTDVSKDTFKDKYIIRGNEIYYNGKVAFTIYNPNMIEDTSGNYYVRVKTY